MTEPPNIPTHELEQLLEMLREAQLRADERAKVTHERFNVFTTLLKAHDEVRLHTRFLHCLLDPKGCHDCKDLFLKLFFATLADHPGKNHDDSPAEFSLPPPQTIRSVEKEASANGFGKIDILLEQQQFGVAIENKIYHGEGDDQLARYASYLENKFGNGLVIFLTLDGKRSVTHEGRIPYMRISYSNHILAWLEKCLRETHDIVPINQVLLQYRAVVRKLTGKNLENKAMDKIAEFITGHPDIISFRKQIDEGINKACTDFFKSLADEIKKGLREFRVRAHEQKEFGVDPYGALVIKTPINNLPFDVHIEYATGTGKDGEDEQVVVVGISGDFKNQPTSPEQDEIFNRMYEKLIAKGYRDYRPNSGWPTGWDNLLEELDDAGIALLVKNGPTKTASEVCGKIQDYIAVLKDIYSEVIQQTNVQQ